MIKMDFFYFYFMVALGFVEGIWSLPLACSYNGTSYGEGDTVRTEEPCLSCVCQRGTLECSLRVCADHPGAPPPGCFFLHKPDDCCPQLLCEEETLNPVEIELRKGFQWDNKTSGNDCTINGSLYAEGSAVASSQPCEYCYCMEGVTKCLKHRCLRSFEGCKANYEKFSCCPTHYDCRNTDAGLLRTQIKNLVLASVDSGESDDSSRSFSNFEEKSPEEISSGSKVSENLKNEGITQKEIEEVETTTTETSNTEETTVAADTATPPAEGFSTSNGFQTMRTEYSGKESTTVDFMEQTTLAVETITEDVFSVEGEGKESWNVREKLNFSNIFASFDAGNRSGSSQEAEDSYDSYDYDEPQLPPSLPNLVIFPFVAADAVVKDKTSEVLDVHEQIEIKRIDAHPVFFKDYFSPPMKTEGGFIPKEPLKLDERFYELDHFGKGEMELKTPHLHAEEQKPKVLIGGNIGSDLRDATPSPFAVEIPGPSMVPPGFILDDPPPVHKILQTKKPVTVTYKNVVVDFYPNYLITTTRAHPHSRPVENQSTAEGGFDRPFLAFAPSDGAGERIVGYQDETKSSSAPKKTRDTPPHQTTKSMNATTTESSFFDEFFKSFFPDKSVTTKTTTSASSIKFKHKYSSKIKGQGDVSSIKPFRNKVAEDGNGMSPNLLNQTEDSSATASWTTESKTSNVRKQVKHEGVKSFTKYPSRQKEATAKPVEAKDEKIEFRLPPTKENFLGESVEGWRVSDPDKTETGALLKLAGCNIYGMMYRVGKVITELSGPCLECLCTDFGVQCRPLKC